MFSWLRSLLGQSGIFGDVEADAHSAPSSPLSARRSKSPSHGFSSPDALFFTGCEGREQDESGLVSDSSKKRREREQNEEPPYEERLYTSSLRRAEHQRQEEQKRLEQQRLEQLEQQRRVEKQRQEEQKRLEQQRLEQLEQQRRVEKQRQEEQKRLEKQQRLEQLEQQRRVEKQRQEEQKRLEQQQRLKQLEQQRRVEKQRQEDEHTDKRDEKKKRGKLDAMQQKRASLSVSILWPERMEFTSSSWDQQSLMKDGAQYLDGSHVIDLNNLAPDPPPILLGFICRQGLIAPSEILLSENVSRPDPELDGLVHNWLGRLKHNKMMEVCSACGKTASKFFFVGGMRFHDGCLNCCRCSRVIEGGKFNELHHSSGSKRLMAPLCFDCKYFPLMRHCSRFGIGIVSEDRTAEALFQFIVQIFTQLKILTDVSSIPVQVLSQDELSRRGKDAGDCLGLCVSQGKKVVKILVRTGMPYPVVLSVLAHELSHALTAQKGCRMSEFYEEGLAELFSFIMYNTLRLPSTHAFVRSMDLKLRHENLDETYGAGLREAKDALKVWVRGNKSVPDFVQHVWQQGSFPKTEPSESSAFNMFSP